jgi:antitoxin ParD1/3/4
LAERFKDHTPGTYRLRLDKFPKPIIESLEEAITCHANQRSIASAIMVRKTLESLCSAYVEEQVSAGAYSSAGEYVRELVRTDQKRKARKVLEQTLLAALNEGDAEQATPEWWATLRAELTKRSKARKPARKS